MKYPQPGRRKRGGPLFGSAGGGISRTAGGVAGAVRAAGRVTAPVKVKAPPKPKAAGPTINDIFGLISEADMEKSAHDAASAAILSKSKAIDAAIQAEKDRTSYNVDLMRQVYAEFATFLQGGAAQVQDIYAKAGQQSADFTKGMLGGMNAATSQVNAANNAVMAGINAPAGQYSSGDFGAAAHIQAQAQNFGDLLAAQGADWAAYMAVQPGIYSKMAVYNIGKMLTESTRRLALLEAQKVGLSDEESAAYADALAQLQKDQYNRRVDALKYQQQQEAAQAKAAELDWQHRYKTWAEQQKNARFAAGLEASGLKATKTATARAKTVDPTASRAVGYLVNKDGTPHLVNGKRVAVQGKGPAAPGKINVTASKAKGQWVDGAGRPVPGMAGVPVPKDTPSKGSTKTPKTGIDNRETDWGRMGTKMVASAQRYLKNKYGYDQAFKLLTEEYGWWVRRYGVTPALKKKLRARLNAKIDRVLSALGITKGGGGAKTGGGGNTFTP